MTEISRPLRLAEAVGALSLATNLAMGQPLEHGLRTEERGPGYEGRAPAEDDWHPRHAPPAPPPFPPAPPPPPPPPAPPAPPWER